MRTTTATAAATAAIILALLAPAAAETYVAINNGTCEQHGYRTVRTYEECATKVATSASLICGLDLPGRRLKHSLTTSKR